jgi:hypothetical protein
MKLLREITDDCNVEIITEGVGTDKKYFIEGIFLQADVKNRNGRIYPYEIMSKQVNEYIEKYVNDNRALGELGHPTNPSINYDCASHKIVSLREESKNFIGKAKIMDTPKGKIVKTLMDEGVKMGASSRALGSLKEINGTKVVQEDFHLITAADIVSDPSAPDAFVSNLMENKEWIWENGNLIVIEKEIKTSINTLSKKGKLNEENLLKVFNYILSKI